MGKTFRERERDPHLSDAVDCTENSGLFVKQFRMRQEGETATEDPMLTVYPISLSPLPCSNQHQSPSNRFHPSLMLSPTAMNSTQFVSSSILLYFQMF